MTDALDELESTSLIERVDEITVRLHPLVRDFAISLISATECNDFGIQCAEYLTDAYTNPNNGMLRLGKEYATRGIPSVLIDLTTALNLIRFDSDYAQFLVFKLQSLLRLLRREAHTLQSTTWLRQYEQLWQQLLLSASVDSDERLSIQLIKLLQPTLHWLPWWKNQRQLLCLEQTLIDHKDTVTSVCPFAEKFSEKENSLICSRDEHRADNNHGTD